MRQVPVNCQVCGSPDEREFRDLGEYRLAQCIDCAHIYINPRPDPAGLIDLYEQARMYFRDDYEPLGLELPVLKGVLRDLKKFVPSGRFLEVGCGRGELLELAEKNGYRVDGCDLQRSPVLPADLPIYLGPLRDIDFPDETFDCIVMRNVVEHLFDPAEELQVCHRLLKAGGCVYIKVPSADYHYGLKWLLTQKPHLFNPPWHLNYFSQQGLSRFLERNGFRVVSWLVEQPTADPRFLHNTARKGGYLLFESMRRLTRGAYFPKPLLTCVARKQAPPLMPSVRVSAIEQNPAPH
jgi:SAM-dependent methyltransferase